MAILDGGGYAEYVAVPEGLCMPIPKQMSYFEAAATPESWLTSFQLLHNLAKVRQGEFVLVHAAGSGVSSAAIQMARAAGATVLATAGSEAKCEYARERGAHFAFNYKSPSPSERAYAGGKKGRCAPHWETQVRDVVGRHGVDVILDCVGAAYWQSHLALASIL